MTFGNPLNDAESATFKKAMLPGTGGLTGVYVASPLLLVEYEVASADAVTVNLTTMPGLNVSNGNCMLHRGSEVVVDTDVVISLLLYVTV